MRCACLAAAVVLALGVLPWSWASLVLPSLSPYVLIASAVATRTLSVATLVGLPVLVVVLVRRRWFCRHACPVGLLTEQASRLRRGGKSWTRRLPRLGTWIVLLTLGGACFGYPLLLWLDPLAIFQGVFTLRQAPLSPAGQASAAALAAILSISVLLPGAWCVRICPLGATQDLLAAGRRGVANLFVRTRAREAPKGAPGASRSLLPRRSVLSAAFGALCAGVGARFGIDLSNPRPREGRKPLRPPGSADERQLAGLCIRCGNCVRACPVRIIEPGAAAGGIAGWLAPVIRFEKDYCREDCRACTQVCPSGAISRLSLDQKRRAPIGLATLDPSICLLAEDRECDVCARVCPFEAIDIVWDEEEYIALPKVDAAKCPGCGACEVGCPGTNQWEREHAREPVPLRKAIEVHPRRGP